MPTMQYLPDSSPTVASAANGMTSVAQVTVQRFNDISSEIRLTSCIVITLILLLSVSRLLGLFGDTDSSHEESEDPKTPHEECGSDPLVNLNNNDETKKEALYDKDVIPGHHVRPGDNITLSTILTSNDPTHTDAGSLLSMNLRHSGLVYIFAISKISAEIWRLYTQTDFSEYVQIFLDPITNDIYEAQIFSKTHLIQSTDRDWENLHFSKDNNPDAPKPDWQNKPWHHILTQAANLSPESPNISDNKNLGSPTLNYKNKIWKRVTSPQKNDVIPPIPYTEEIVASLIPEKTTQHTGKSLLYFRETGFSEGFAQKEFALFVFPECSQDSIYGENIELFNGVSISPSSLNLPKN